jgi:hypothetical protein
MGLDRIVLFSAAVFCAWVASPAMPASAQTRVEAEGICRTAVVRKYGSEYDFDRTDAVLGRDGDYDVTVQAHNRRGERFEFFCTLDGRRVRDVDRRYAGGGGQGHGRDREVTCESRNHGRRDCPMDTRGGVRLVEQISETRCRQGTNWGYDRDSVWVDRGCAARFSSRGGGGGGPIHSAGLARACEEAAAERAHTRDVRALEPPRRRSDGIFEYEMRTPHGPWTCVIERNGKVRAVISQTGTQPGQ